MVHAHKRLYAQNHKMHSNILGFVSLWSFLASKIVYPWSMIVSFFVTFSPVAPKLVHALVGSLKLFDVWTEKIVLLDLLCAPTHWLICILIFLLDLLRTRRCCWLMVNYSWGQRIKRLGVEFVIQTIVLDDDECTRVPVVKQWIVRSFCVVNRCW
jgi:hypothetical protein